jgi:hypothetical protein
MPQRTTCNRKGGVESNGQWCGFGFDAVLWFTLCNWPTSGESGVNWYVRRLVTATPQRITQPELCEFEFVMARLKCF